MYWYNINKKYCSAVMVLVLTALFLSCADNTQKEKVSAETYFDIPTYFREEVARLTLENPLVEKTVLKDSLSETKSLQIADWDNELSSFVSIDLNKPVYAGVLKRDSTANRIVITSTDPKLDLVQIEIQYGENSEPTAFRIQRHVQNSLFETQETLFYAKDKEYSLEKQQSIRILGDKYYRVEGLFNRQTEPKK